MADVLLEFRDDGQVGRRVLLEQVLARDRDRLHRLIDRGRAGRDDRRRLLLRRLANDVADRAGDGVGLRVALHLEHGVVRRGHVAHVRIRLVVGTGAARGLRARVRSRARVAGAAGVAGGAGGATAAAGSLAGALDEVVEGGV